MAFSGSFSFGAMSTVQAIASNNANITTNYVHTKPISMTKEPIQLRPLHEYLHYLLEHLNWDDAVKHKLMQLMHFDHLEYESIQKTLANSLEEVERLHMTMTKQTDGLVSSNQLDDDTQRPEEENNQPEDEKNILRGGKYYIPDAIETKPPPVKPHVTHASPARRRSSLRRKSLVVTACKSSPGKISVSPAKHGLANQLMLVKAKTNKKSSKNSQGDEAQPKWAIKIARKFKPLNLSLFSFHPDAATMPSPVLELGPQQNAMMLRQLRYVKGVMHDLPWAKSRLRDMLSQYTQKELSKELLFPQLSHLSTQVQDELQAKSKAQKSMMEIKSKLTVTLQLAKSVINDLYIVKFGRRGKPHETKLYYDECHPSMLYWQSKQGDRSSAFMPLHAVKSIEIGIETAVLKKAAKKQMLDADCCLSMVTEERTLDLKLKNALQRDWLYKALREVVDYAIQYRSNHSTKKGLNVMPRLRRM